MTDVKIKFSSKDCAEVAEDTVFSVGNKRFVVPKGFETDGASIPWPLNFFITRKPRLWAPSVLHDWLYTTHEVSREHADVIFYLMLLRHKTGLIEAWLMFRAVRIGGWWLWPKEKLQD